MFSQVFVDIKLVMALYTLVFGLLCSIQKLYRLVIDKFGFEELYRLGFAEVQSLEVLCKTL